MINIVAFQPDIPQNLGALIRLSACFGAPLCIIEPCGFPLGDRGLRRVSMDYFKVTDISIRKSWQDFSDNLPKSNRKILLTTKSNKNYNTFRFKDSDNLILGSESSGVPE